MSETLVFLLGMSTGWSLHSMVRRLGKMAGKALARRDIARAERATLTGGKEKP